MEFKVLVEKRRSCREFKNEPLTREQIEAIVTAGQWAPSPLNQQPFQFIAVTDPALKTRIQKAGLATSPSIFSHKVTSSLAKRSSWYLVQEEATFGLSFAAK